jgi:hypothetical protein
LIKPKYQKGMLLHPLRRAWQGHRACWHRF